LHFATLGIFAYILDGAAWILYFESIVAGPITIVGTLSAAYPALTVLFARFFLNETLLPLQYFGVAAVIIGCLLLSYSPETEHGKKILKRWVPLAAIALVVWGISGGTLFGGGGGGDVFNKEVDTLYWNDKLKTGTDGRLTVPVPVGNTETTWKIVTYVSTDDTKVGQADYDMLVVK
jgi:hypothetical protein